MNYIILILTGLFYLTPGMADILYHYVDTNEKQLLCNAYSVVINKRNTLYLSALYSVTNLFSPFKLMRLFSYGLFYISVINYFDAIQKLFLYNII